jgi:SecD/SecF fusion protein
MVTSAALSQAVEVLRKRVDRFGVAEPVIQPAGGNRILIQLPGLSEADKESAEQHPKAAYLEFRMVKDDSDDIIKNGEPIPPGYELLKHIRAAGTASSAGRKYVVKKKPENGPGGDIVKSARMVGRGNLGNPEIEFTLTDDGRKTVRRRHHATTSAIAGHRAGRRTLFRAEHQGRD